MADKDNFGEIQDSFNYISEALDSMRAQNAMNAGNLDKVVANINNKLEAFDNEETSELMKVFLVELKRGLEERHNFVSAKFDEIGTTFKDFTKKAETQLTGPEIKELFEIIATNLNNFTTDVTAQKGLISEIGLRIDEIQKDESQKKEILKNISTLKNEIEKFGNGFESVILNLNKNFGQVSEILTALDPKEDVKGLKKDIENISLSSNAILSTMQVIDRKNRDLEAVINTYVTKDDFEIEREQVAELIAQNIQLTDYIKKLPTHINFTNLTEKIDTSIGVINALKNMLGETSKQNQEMLSAQLDNLEAKILNISTEDEFIGFRKELSEFAKDVMENTNLIRADLADTNEGLRSLYEFLNTIDIKNSFLNFTEITKNTEKRMNETFAETSAKISDNITKNQKATKSDINKGVAEVNESLDLAKEELIESSKTNLSSVLENIQSVISNMFSIKKEIQIEDAAKMDVLDGKFQNLKEDVVSTGHSVIKSSQDNLMNLLTNLEKIFNEILKVNQTVDNSSERNSSELSQKFNGIEARIKEIKNELNQNSKESFENLLSIVEDFSLSLSDTKEALEGNFDENSGEIKEIIGGLSLKLNSLQEVLTKGYEINFSEIKGLIEGLISTTQSAKTSLEQKSTFGFSGLSANIEELSHKLQTVEENLENKSQSNFENINALFESLSVEFDGYKNHLSESVQASFESVSLYFQSLSKKMEDSKLNLDEKLNTKFSQVHDSISSLPETIKQNQEIFENEKRNLIEGNSQEIRELNEKIQSLILGIMSKDRPFKEEVIYEFSEIKNVLHEIKTDFTQSTCDLDENITNQVNESLENTEKLMEQYSEKYNSSFINLQNKINSYLESFTELSQESGLKLEGSLRETFEIKAEIKALMERVLEIKDDTSVAALADDINQRFDSILIDISQLEENSTAKNNDQLQNILSNLEAKFEAVSDEIRAHKNKTSSIPQEILVELQDKTEMLKAQLNLITTDIINIVSSRTGEIITRLVSLSENIEQVSNFDFEEAFIGIKNRLDGSASLIISSLQQEVERGNFEQTEQISQKFENVDEKLAKILFKVSSDNTKEINELKSILTEKVDNITSINNLLETVANEIENTNAFYSTLQNSVGDSRDALLEKINSVEDILLQAQEDSRENINSKTAELQNRATSTILTKVEQAFEASKTTVSNEIDQAKIETQNSIEELKNKISTVSEDIAFSLKNEKQETEEKLLDKIHSLIQNQEDNKYALIDEINKVQDIASASTSREIQEIISNMNLSTNSATAGVILSAKGELTAQINDIENNLLLSQEETQKIIKAGFAQELGQVNNSVNEISETQSENSEILMGISEKQEATKELINLVAQKQEKTENIFDEISQRQINTKLFIENISRIQQENSSVINKINESQEETVTLVNQIVQNQDDTKDLIFEKLNLSSEEIQSAVVNKIVETQDEAKTSIINEIIDLSEKNKEALLYRIKDNTANLDINIRTSIEENMSRAKTDISEKIDTLENDLLSSQNDFKEGLSEEFGEVNESINLIIEKQSQNAELLSQITQNQEDTKNSILSEIIDENERNKESVLYGVKETVSNANTNLASTIEKEAFNVKTNISEKIDNLENTLLSSQNDLKNMLEGESHDEFDEINESINLIMEKQSQNAELLSQITQNQEETKNSILSEIIDENERNKESVLYGVKETVSNTNTNLASIIEKEVHDAKIDLEEKIDNLENDLLSSQNDFKEGLSEEFGEVNESINLIIEKQSQNAELLSQITQNQEDTKNSILSEIIEENERNKESVLYGVKETVSNTNTNLVSTIEKEVFNVKINLEEKIDNLEDSLLSSNTQAKESIIDRISQELDSVTNSINEITEKQSENAELLSEMAQTQEENRLAILDNIAQSQNEVKTEIIDKISKLNYDTENLILGELEANIKTIKEVLIELSEKDEDIEEINEDSEQIEELKTTMLELSETISTKIQETEENYKTSTQSMLSDIKVSFSEKVEDSFDSLKSFMEVFENKIDVSNLLDDLKSDVFDKITEISGNIEYAITTVSVKDELIEVSNEIGASIDNLFEDIKGEITASLENCESIKNVSEKTEEVQRNIESLKSSVIQDISEKMDEFELSASVQRKEISELVESVKTNIEELKENYVDLSLNSNMEISSLLLTIQEEISGLQPRLEALDIKENIEKIETKIDNSTEEIKQEFEAINQKVDLLVEAAQSEENAKEDKIIEEIQGISQKLDLLALDANADSETEQNLNEIKQILNSQDEFIKKLDKIETVPQLSDLQNTKTEIKQILDTFETKLNTLIESSETDSAEGNVQGTIKESLTAFKEEIVENLISVFNEISFIEESEDIKDFVGEKIDEVKTSIEGLKTGIKPNLASNTETTFESNADLGEVLSSLDSLHEKASTVDNSCFDIKKEIEEVKEHLLATKATQDEESEYSYTLQDIESDIAKVRLILKDISETQPADFNIEGLDKLDKLDKLNDLTKLSEDITSISTRTNKLLLNSDESYTALNDNLQDLKDVIYQFDKKVKFLDNKEPINKIDKKLDNMNNLMLSCVQSDKIFNQTFMYLAEWIDKADEKMSNIEQNMVKKSDVEAMFEKFVKKMDRQQVVIKSLEDKVNKLSKKEPATKQTDLKTIINEVLSKVEMPVGKTDTKLAKQVDGIDKQLTALGKNIEKITSYVD